MKKAAFTVAFFIAYAETVFSEKIGLAKACGDDTIAPEIL